MRRGLLILALACAAVFPFRAAASTLYVFEGRGYGHGIGMSQYGAYGFARHGWEWQRILRHYYTGTSIGRVPGRTVRVQLVEGKRALRIASSRPFRVVDGRGHTRRLAAGSRLLRPAALARLGGSLRYTPGAAPLRLGADAYRGALVVRRVAGRLEVVNELSLELYLRGVVPWEMPSDWHPQALAAQAVAARSYALATLKPRRRYDLYADTRSQVYGGLRAETPATSRAVTLTSGRIVTWAGRVATTFFHSTSGGRTASIADAWPGSSPVPYLRAVVDPYDSLSKHHRWGPIVLTQAAVGRRLGVRGVSDVFTRAAASGRVSALLVRTPAGTRAIEGPDARRELELDSTWFDVRVLSLRPPAVRPRRGAPVELSGLVRGLGRVRLERRVATGDWRRVTTLRPRADGRFVAVVRPPATSVYRLASSVATGAAVRVVLR